MSWKLDTSDKSQVQTPEKSRRTIYDARPREIFGKSLLAGFALGLGQTLATVLFFGFIAGLLITTLRPFLEQIGVPIDELEVVLQQRVDQAEDVLVPPATFAPTPTTAPTQAPTTAPTTSPITPTVTPIFSPTTTTTVGE